VSRSLVVPVVLVEHEDSCVRADRLAELFEAHRERLWRLARRMCRDAEEARDLVQEAFVRLARLARGAPADDRHAEAWLVKTLVHLCRDRERHLRVRRRHAMQPCAASSDRETSAVARLAVQDALARLSPRRRAVVALHDLEGQTTPEIARLLGVAPVTVRWHLHAAHRDLRRILLPSEDR
jgi:RNA polymerase sigma-70 factor, ECF subfamily